MNLMDRATLAIDSINTRILLAQDIPGQNLQPKAPPGFGEKINAAMGYGQWLGIVIAVFGVIAVGASMAISRREGESEQATSNALRIGIGCLVIGSAGTIVAMLMK